MRLHLLLILCFAILILAQEDFYIPPAGFESTQPGTVLRSRAIRPAFLGIVPTLLSSQTYQLLYRSTAVDGSAIASVTTVFIPWNAQNDRMVSFNSFEDSAASQCAPSRNVQLDGTASNLLVQINILLIQAYLLKGWIVVVPDEEGPDSAFSAGRLAGMLTLDSIRAVKSFEPVGLQPNAMIVGSGYSGGAIAAGWAASLKESYADELNTVGWALGGTPANLTGTFVNIDGQLFAGFLPAAIAGLSTKSAYPQLRTVIDKVATSIGKEALEFARSKCAVDDILQFRYKLFQDRSFSSLGDQLLYDSDVVKVLDDNLMGRNAAETPKAPIYIYHSTKDGVIPMSNATALRDTWCKNGAKVHFDTYSESGHAGLSISGLVNVIEFVDRAFNGVTSSTCTQRQIQPTALSLSFILEPLFIELLNILQRLGPGDINVQQQGAQLLQSAVPTRVEDT